MKHPFLIGETIYLRGLDILDAEAVAEFTYTMEPLKS